jgi:iron complex outermembrane receptor protein
VTLNGAAFHTDYRDIQLSVFTTYDSDGDGIDDSQFGDLKNAGRATINGAEIELAAELTPAVQWMFHAGYLDAKYDEFISAGVDIADTQQFANSPRWTSGTSAIADIPLGQDRGRLQFRVDGNYQSRTIPSADLVQDIAQAGYTLWNASLSYRSPNERWHWALRGNNLGDKAYRVTGYDFPALGIRSGFFGPPRTYSLAFTYSF